MKKSSKNEVDVLSLIDHIQIQLTALDKKIDTLINRSVPNVKPSPTPLNDRSKERMMHKAICADCKKECTIPFKPSGDRPVYCKDCFSRRKVISMSGMKVENTSQVNIQGPEVKEKKKAATAKKPTGKKKPVPKKK